MKIPTNETVHDMFSGRYVYNLVSFVRKSAPPFINICLKEILFLSKHLEFNFIFNIQLDLCSSQVLSRFKYMPAGETSW